MTSTNFAYWLQGFFEISNPEEITPEQLKMIKAHLKLVFRDDIDPKMGDKKHQELLTFLHNNSSNNNGNTVLERC
jgi:hypothetical protein